MLIFGIETSCDETAASVVEAKQGVFKILSSVVSSQVKIHAQYGGVVPEVAARLHIEKILPIVKLALRRARVSFRSNSQTLNPCTTASAGQASSERDSGGEIDYIAVCAGPGLMSSLMAGVETAKTLAYAYNKPLIRINHLEGHLLSSLIEESKNKIKFPALGLIVSGGHTQLILMRDYLKYKIIGETRDDAVGEAFDKVAQILGLGYPGGPAVSAEAEKAQNPKPKTSAFATSFAKAMEVRKASSFAKAMADRSADKQNKFKIVFPRPMLDSVGFEFSFSGLKTAVLYKWAELKKDNKYRPLVAREFQSAVIDVLVSKMIQAAQKFNVKTMILGGGVSANQVLRRTLREIAEKRWPGVNLYCPPLSLTGDNAAMIAATAYYHIKEKDFVTPFNLKADPNWRLA